MPNVPLPHLYGLQTYKTRQKLETACPPPHTHKSQFLCAANWYYSVAPTARPNDVSGVDPNILRKCAASCGRLEHLPMSFVSSSAHGVNVGADLAELWRQGDDPDPCDGGWAVDRWDGLDRDALPLLDVEPDLLLWPVAVDGLVAVEKTVGAPPRTGCGHGPEAPRMAANPVRRRQASPGKKASPAAPGRQQALPPSKSASPRKSTRPKRQYRKTIANATCLRMLYVPGGMHDGLNLASMYPMLPSGHRKNKCVIYLSAGPGPSHPVTMTRSVSKRLHYRRLTTGWRDFCVAIGVQVGDALTFSTGRRPNEVRVRVSWTKK